MRERLVRAGALALVLPLTVGAGAVTFPPPERPVARIISPAYSDEATRDRHGEAEQVMDRLGIRPGVRVADIGAGSGYYTVRLARRLGPAATIYAEDIKPEYLAQLRERLERERITGVTLVLGSPGNPRLPLGSIEVALLSHVYHEIEHPFEFLYELQPALAAGARVGIVDANRPTQDHGTPPALLRCELSAVGYRQVDFVTLPPGDAYLAVFAPPGRRPHPATIKACK